MTFNLVKAKLSSKLLDSSYFLETNNPLQEEQSIKIEYKLYTNRDYYPTNDL